MAKFVDIHKAKAVLSALVRAAEAGAQVVLSRRGRPAVRLVPVKQRRQDAFGMDAGLVWIAPDFDETAESLLRDFEGGED